jgi:hypothetical protein
MVAVDVLFSYLWMAVLLWMAANHERIDRSLHADTTAIAALSDKMERLRLQHERIPSLADLMIMLGLAFGATGLSHALAAPLAKAFAGVEWAERLSLASEFFWVVVLATTFGLLLSFTRARQLEGAGASRLGTVFLYVLIATVGMQMNLRAVLTAPVLFGIGFTWIAFHAIVMLVVARLIPRAHVLPRRRQPGKHRRRRERTGGRRRVSSIARPGGCAARGPGIRSRHLRRLALRTAHAAREPVALHAPRAPRVSNAITSASVVNNRRFSQLHRREPALRRLQHSGCGCFSDAHVGTDKANGRDSLATAIQQSEGTSGFEWDIALDLGDISGAQGDTQRREGQEVVRQFGALKRHRREQIYDLSGNHDRAVSLSHKPGGGGNGSIRPVSTRSFPASMPRSDRIPSREPGSATRFRVGKRPFSDDE